MRVAVVVVAGLLMLNLLIVLGTATGTGYARPLALGLLYASALAALVYGLMLLVSRLIKQPLSQHGPSMAPSGEGAESRGRSFVVAAVALFVEFLILAGVPRGFGMIGEGLYYLVLFLSGVALAVWARSPPVAPIWVASGILLLLAVGQAARFVADPGARWQYGPEAYLFMLWGYAGRANMLPLDAVVAWSGWETAALLRRGPTRR